MGLLNKMRNLAGSVPKELLDHGLLGRGIIVSIQQTGVSTGADFDPTHVCVFTLEVALDNVPRYTATCRQAVRATILPQLMMPAQRSRCASIPTTTAASRCHSARSRRP
jgi:hypothetical protein